MEEKLIRAKRKANTRRAVKTVLKIWRIFSHEKPLAEATSDDAFALLDELAARKNADSTIHHRFCVLSKLYRALSGNEKNPFRQVLAFVSLNKEAVTRPTPLYEGDVRAVIKSAECLRDEVMLALSFYCGLRRSELCGLNVGDVLVNDRYLMLIDTKTSTLERQYIPRKLTSLLVRYIIEKKNSGAKNDDPLFLSQKKSRMSDRQWARIFKKYTSLAPHSARATFATKLYESGADTIESQRSLRHRTGEMTFTYIKRWQGRTNKAIERMNY